MAHQVRAFSGKVLFSCPCMDGCLAGRWESQSQPGRNVPLIIYDLLVSGKDDYKVFARLRRAIKNEYGPDVEFTASRIHQVRVVNGREVCAESPCHPSRRRPSRSIFLFRWGSASDAVRFVGCLRKAGISVDFY